MVTKGAVMAANKTKATEESVDGYLAGIEDEGRREDCVALAKLMTKATKQQPKMWGAGIVGFGSYHYKYESGREGDSCLVGFSSRKGDIAIYLVGDFPGRDELLGKLGKHKTAKACLHVRRLSDVDLKVLEQLVVASVEQRKLNHA
ncbi:MAG TPA: DUF1801 domain-containing protein [Thermoanaerobaculia bacterium]